MKLSKKKYILALYDLMFKIWPEISFPGDWEQSSKSNINTKADFYLKSGIHLYVFVNM